MNTELKEISQEKYAEAARAEVPAVVRQSREPSVACIAAQGLAQDALAKEGAGKFASAFVRAHKSAQKRCPPSGCGSAP